MTGNQVRQKYLDFFASRGHVIVPSAPLVPENDPTTLFTGSGMQPMLQYLLGNPYPEGATRVADSQKCFRAQDIEEVGDNRHDTFFEMLGNWSLGDYFKKEQLTWIFEFFTKDLGLSADRLYVTVFEGDSEIPKDDEAVEIWKSLGIPKERIFFYPEKKNWWSRVGGKSSMPEGEPGGPTSEIFYDFKTPHDKKFGEECHPNCDCGRFVEIGNNVFMTYKKTTKGLEPLAKKNIDFGGGFERILAAVNDDDDQFKTDIYWPIIQELEKISDKKYASEFISHFRIIADHIKASVMLISDGVRPANKGQGYFLRRLIRRAAVKMRQLDAPLNFDSIIQTISDLYPLYSVNVSIVSPILGEEIGKFQKTLDLGLKMVDKVSAFDLYQSYGFPIEITGELYKEKGLELDMEKFNAEKNAHQNSSRTASKGMFKGGLQDQSEQTTKYHTATHLLHASLRKVLGDHVSQKGSNITGERLRFDFSHPKKVTPEELQLIEDMVNAKIKEGITVERLEMKKQDALDAGALAFFPEKYPDMTSAYKVGDFSFELCGGPHVTNTAEIGTIKILKTETVGSGIQRIYATALLQKT